MYGSGGFCACVHCPVFVACIALWWPIGVQLILTPVQAFPWPYLASLSRGGLYRDIVQVMGLICNASSVFVHADDLRPPILRFRYLLRCSLVHLVGNVLDTPMEFM